MASSMEISRSVAEYVLTFVLTIRARFILTYLYNSYIRLVYQTNGDVKSGLPFRQNTVAGAAVVRRRKDINLKNRLKRRTSGVHCSETITTRKPIKLCFRSGGYWFRKAERQLSPPSYHEPPRNTRSPVFPPSSQLLPSVGAPI